MEVDVMGRTILEVQPLDAPFGAVVSGMDFGQALDADAHTAIRAALHEYRMLIFRGESRPDAKLVSFAERFGSLITLYEHDTTVPGYPGIVRVSNVEENGRPIGLAGNQALPWHHDHSYLERPAKESFLPAPLDEADVDAMQPTARDRRLKRARAMGSQSRWCDPGEAAGSAPVGDARASTVPSLPGVRVDRPGLS